MIIFYLPLRGPAGAGWVVTSGDDLHQTEYRYIGKATNNEAEYIGMIEALKLCQKLDILEADVYMDSNLVVQQMLGKFKVKKPNLQKLFLEAKSLSKDMKVGFFHVRREKNEIADYLANLAFK